MPSETFITVRMLSWAYKTRQPVAIVFDERRYFLQD